MMRKIYFFLGAISFLLCLSPGWGQAVNRKVADNYLAEGEIGKAEKLLSSYLKRPADLSLQDSVYIFKNLGVLFGASSNKKAEGDKLFHLLLKLDPYATIHDTYASHAVLQRFARVRKSYQQKVGGKSLKPLVAVFDFRSQHLWPEDKNILTRQFIAELKRLPLFRVAEREKMNEVFERTKLSQEECREKECFRDLARSVNADKWMQVEVIQIDTIFTFNVGYFDVESNLEETFLKMVFPRNKDALIESGLAKLANELVKQEAAWLKLSVEPKNTYLNVDGEPLDGLGERIALNPGKHRVCGHSPGYETLCKDFMAKKNDALTHSFQLPLKGGEKRENKDEANSATTSGVGEDGEEEFPDGAMGESNRFVWWTLGSMALLVAGLALLWNTQD